MVPQWFMRVHIFTLLRLESRSHSGDDGDEDPPVPIPNTEVKLIYGESSWHRAPARIANCRISIKNDRFSTEKRSFFLYSDHFFFFAVLSVFCQVLLSFMSSID